MHKKIIPYLRKPTIEHNLTQLLESISNELINLATTKLDRVELVKNIIIGRTNLFINIVTEDLPKQLISEYLCMLKKTFIIISVDCEYNADIRAFCMERVATIYGVSNSINE